MTSTPTRRVGSFGSLRARGPAPTRVSPGEALPSGLVGPLLLAAVGVVAVLGGALVLRTYGAAYKVGRLLATTPLVSVEEALALAAGSAGRAGAAPYLGVRGRVDSDDDFPDEHERPLVFRRARLQWRRRGTWRTAEDGRQVVPFDVREGLAAIAVDGDALDVGLVVIPRESRGTAAEVPDRLPLGTPPATPVRFRIDQVSAVEHATVLGVPVARGSRALMTAGAGRPLVLTTLETAEAMRILAGGRRERPLLAAGLLMGGLGLLAVGLVWGVVAGVGG